MKAFQQESLRAVGGADQYFFESTDFAEIGNPVTDFLPGPNPAGMQIKPTTSRGYLLPADCFDSLYGEFRSNTRTR
jgi:hypothetical protein